MLHACRMIGGKQFDVVIRELCFHVAYHIAVRVCCSDTACANRIYHGKRAVQFAICKHGMFVAAQRRQSVAQVRHKSLGYGSPILPGVNRYVRLRPIVVVPRPNLLQFFRLYHRVFRLPIIYPHRLFQIFVFLHPNGLLRAFYHRRRAFRVSRAACVGNIVPDNIDHIFRIQLVVLIKAAMVFLHHHQTSAFGKRCIGNNRVFVRPCVIRFHLPHPLFRCQLRFQSLSPLPRPHLQKQYHVKRHVHDKRAFSALHHGVMPFSCFVAVILSASGRCNRVLLIRHICHIFFAFGLVRKTDGRQNYPSVFLCIERRVFFLCVFFRYDSVDIIASKSGNCQS